MEAQSTPSGARLLRRIFVSPDEPRLRAGWRMTVHGVLMLALVLITSLLLAVPLALLGLTDVSNFDELLLPLTAVAMLPAVFLATWIARRLVDKRPVRSLGFPTGAPALSDLAVGFLIPAPLFAAVYGLFRALGWLEFEGWAGGQQDPPSVLLNLFVIGVVFVAVGFYEEVLFRGYYLQNLIEGTNLPVAVLLSSAGFGLAHLGNLSALPESSIGIKVAAPIGITLAGLFLVYAWHRGRSLWLPIGIHIGWNFFQGPVFGFQVSGTITPTLLQHTVDGPALITGGEFGPEAGLIVIPIMALGSALIWLYTRDRGPMHQR